LLEPQPHEHTFGSLFHLSLHDRILIQLQFPCLHGQISAQEHVCQHLFDALRTVDIGRAIRGRNGCHMGINVHGIDGCRTLFGNDALWQCDGCRHGHFHTVFLRKAAQRSDSQNRCASNLAQHESFLISSRTGCPSASDPHD
jgi:hypothetical protein